MSKHKKTPASPTDLDKHLGKRLKALRILKSVSQSALAEELGVSFQQIQKYETAKNRISASRLYKISKFLRVSLLAFFAGYEEKDPPKE